MAKVLSGPVLGEWEDTQKRAEIILRVGLGMTNLVVGDDAVVYVTAGDWNQETYKMTEIGMLIFVSEEQWVFRPKSAYS